MEVKPNVVLIVVDQMRFDSLAVNGNPLTSTPTLDMMAMEGYNFKNAYTAVPSCIPSRAALHTGLKQENHGRVGYEEGITWNYKQTIAKEFTQLGYQTEAIGKMHVSPKRNRLGFEHVLLHDGYLHSTRNVEGPYKAQYERTDDYLSWLKEQAGYQTDLMDYGIECNSWVSRPWTTEERLHPTNWVVNQSIHFLKKRDPMKPTFLNISFTRPHPPLDPPEYYFDLYMDKKERFSEANIGEWVEDTGYISQIDGRKGKIKKDDYNRMIAGYYGSITHIDHQLNRLLIAINEEQMLENTVFLFTSDHGDQLGEHYLFRKSYPYQGSIHIPFIIYDPGDLLEGNIRNIHEIVELRDIYPTLVDITAGETIENIDGLSVKNTLYDKNFETRPYLHGEHSYGEDSNQYILTKEWKYIWYPIQGKEQLFHLKEDPKEQVNLERNEKYTDIKTKLKKLLIDELKNREEGFIENGRLIQVRETETTLDFLYNRE